MTSESSTTPQTSSAWRPTAEEQLRPIRVNNLALGSGAAARGAAVRVDVAGFLAAGFRAPAEVVVVEDNFGIKITELVGSVKP